MDQIEIDKINKTIAYQDGKIYLNENNEWTSKLWEQMLKNGWRLEEDSEMVIVKNEYGNTVFTAGNRIDMLRHLMKILI